MFGKMKKAFDRYLFESCSPETCVLLRISYAVLLVIYVGIWFLDGEKWFSDHGFMSSQTAREILGGPQWSIFFWLPSTPLVVNICLSVLLINTLLLLVGFFSRVQSAAIFFWLVCFQNRNPLICDGEDVVFRLFAFFFMFLPLDYGWSLSKRIFGSRQSCEDGKASAWGLRLVQIQMSLIYLSAAWSKALGATWQDGSAIFYVFQRGDFFGRGPLPAALMESEWVIRSATWAVIFVEATIPLALWYRPTRFLGLLLGIGLHLTIEYSMHLFLFQWVMIVGLLSFLDWSRRQPQPSIQTVATTPLA